MTDATAPTHEVLGALFHFARAHRATAVEVRIDAPGDPRQAVDAHVFADRFAMPEEDGDVDFVFGLHGVPAHVLAGTRLYLAEPSGVRLWETPAATLDKAPPQPTAGDWACRWTLRNARNHFTVVQAACSHGRYHPARVRVHCPQGTYDEIVEARDFLAGSPHVTIVRGIRLGAFRIHAAPPEAPGRERFSLFGRDLTLDLPHRRTRAGRTWRVRADASLAYGLQNCRHLPGDVLKDLEAAAPALIYQAAQAAGDAFDDACTAEAKALGIHL